MELNVRFVQKPPTIDCTESHVRAVEASPVTSHSIQKHVDSLLKIAKGELDRKAYMDLLVHVNDDTQARLDVCNEEIGREMHERRDDD
jgi:hypothetical protein